MLLESQKNGLKWFIVKKNRDYCKKIEVIAGFVSLEHAEKCLNLLSLSDFGEFCISSNCRPFYQIEPKKNIDRENKCRFADWTSCTAKNWNQCRKFCSGGGVVHRNRCPE